MLDKLVTNIFDNIQSQSLTRSSTFVVGLAFFSETQSRICTFCTDIDVGQDNITCNSYQKQRALLNRFYEGKVCIIPVRVRDMESYLHEAYKIFIHIRLLLKLHFIPLKVS